MNNGSADAAGSQEWVAPGTLGEPSVGQLPDAPTAPLAAPAVPVVTAAAPRASTPTYRSWQPGIIPLRPVSFGEFISVPFKAMRYNRAVVIGGPLLAVTVAMLVLAAALWLLFTDPSLALLSPTSQLQGIQTSTVVVGIAAFVALILADAIASAVVAPGVARATLGERITVGAAYKIVSGRIGALLLLWLLSTLAIGVALVPGLVLMIVGIQSQDDTAIGLGALAMFGFAVIVALPVYVITAVARCVIGLERKGAIASIRRTFSVIKGRFWWSLLIVFVTGVIIYIVTAVFQQMLSFVATIGLAIGFNGDWWGTAMFVALLVLASVITYVFTYAYMGCVYALIYIDARIRHEGFDLDLARAAEARRG